MISQYLCFKTYKPTLCYVTFKCGTFIAVYDNNPGWP